MCAECVSPGVGGAGAAGVGGCYWTAPCNNWNGQALCGGVQQGRDLWEHKERRGRVGARKKR